MTVECLLTRFESLVEVDPGMEVEPLVEPEAGIVEAARFASEAVQRVLAEQAEEVQRTVALLVEVALLEAELALEVVAAVEADSPVEPSSRPEVRRGRPRRPLSSAAGGKSRGVPRSVAILWCCCRPL